MEQFSDVYFAFIRYLLPVFAVLFLIVCAKLLLTKNKHLTIARLITRDEEEQFDIRSHESIIGSGKLSDVKLPYPSVLGKHAVITITEYGGKIYPIGDSVLVNGEKITDSTDIYPGDSITLGKVELEFDLPEIEDIASSRKRAVPKEKSIKPALVSLLCFQVLSMISLLFTFSEKYIWAIWAVFFAFILVEWIYLAIFRFVSSLCVELIGFFLTTIGFTISATVGQGALIKQAICFLIGFIGFVVLSLILRKPEFCQKLRYPVGALALALLALTLLFGANINGAKSWIFIGGFSIQPSELVKVAFIFASAATLEKLIKTKNFIWTLALSFAIMGSLALMHDFGAVAIFFVTMMIILFMGLCDKKTIFSLLIFAVAGAAVVVRFMSYVTERFQSFRHAWEYASSTGYQQTRTMIAIANGGLFGLGGGKGKLSAVAAADTDLVFGVVCEQWGLIIGLCAALCLLLLAVTTIANTTGSKSAFYSIVGCSAAGLFLFQTSLNLFGSVDLLPLTGVTMPFVSNGGSSMIAAWLLLSYIKAQINSVTRTNARKGHGD